MRRLLTLVFATILAAGFIPWGATPTAEARSPFPELAKEVFFQQTGHHVSEAFLQYWWYNGGLDTFGFPLTEAFEENGREVQYFERARFEWHPENDAGHQVLLGHLGRQMADGNSRSAFRSFPSDLEFENTAERRFFPQTGHFLAYGFKHYWENNGGLRIFGYPISEELRENGHIVQYFERARFEYHPEHAETPYEVQLGLLGHWAAEQAGVNMSRVGQHGGTPVWPAGLHNPAKWIEINLSTPARLIAWEGDTPVMETYVSGGKPETPTPLGTFEVYWKLRYDDMTGGMAGTSDYYYLPDVPHVMYFYTGGYAIHGTYWHANWGYPMSRGCINMTPADAEWLYNWAPYGTKIWIHY